VLARKVFAELTADDERQLVFADMQPFSAVR
jgi:hypothetical protein